MSKLPKRLQRTDYVVLVCEGKDCKKQGAKDVRKALKNHVKAKGLKRSVLILKTKCTGNCKRAPVCGFNPGNVWVVEATPKTACEAFDAIERK